MRPQRVARVPAAFGFACIVAGCGAVASAPPRPRPPVVNPPVAAISPAVERAAHLTIRPVAAESVHRAAEEITVRVRNVSCEGISLGSGFAVTPHVLLTNRHVLAGASELDINTWDGRDTSVDAAEVGALGDLGVVETTESLPKVAHFGRPAKAGDLVTVVGYPLGGPLTFAPGTVVDRVDGTPFGINGSVVRLTAKVEHGNSGGPVLNAHGQVVAVVFAIEISTGFGLAIPVDTVASLVRAGGLEDVPPCGSD